MKTCPSCKADIADESRFCLYCMTSLDTKKPVNNTVKRTNHSAVWFFLATICVIGIALLIFQLTSKPHPPVNGVVITTTSATTVQTAPTAQHTDVTALSANSTTSATAVPSATASTSAVSQSTVSYVYRPLESGDEFIAVGTPRPENAITIIDVETPAEDGVYDIPAYIDGKPVLAIAEYAFCAAAIAPTVKTVYFPETVTTVNEFAFSSCYNLSDVYYRGNVYIRGYAYPSKEHRAGPLTIHCSEDCHNRNFRLHKNMVSEEENTYYEEWNGD